jgi:hypothetical protein
MSPRSASIFMPLVIASISPSPGLSEKKSAGASTLPPCERPPSGREAARAHKIEITIIF